MLNIGKIRARDSGFEKVLDCDLQTFDNRKESMNDRIIENTKEVNDKLLAPSIPNFSKISVFKIKQFKAIMNYIRRIYNN